jgi:hypothetical protein
MTEGFGRVIAVGSVIRPDFGWSSYLRGGRIEAVPCQCGAQDWAVPFAQFFIPNTGPGGRHGFMDPAVINVRNDQYSHSTALTEGELARNLVHGGLWDRFLREPLATFSDPAQFKPRAWSPRLALIRHLTRVRYFVNRRCSAGSVVAARTPVMALTICCPASTEGVSGWVKACAVAI